MEVLNKKTAMKKMESLIHQTIGRIQDRYNNHLTSVPEIVYLYHVGEISPAKIFFDDMDVVYEFDSPQEAYNFLLAIDIGIEYGIHFKKNINKGDSNERK